MELNKYILKSEEMVLVIIDIQEKLLKAMQEDVAEEVVKNNLILIELSKLYKIPILLTEQYPKGLGVTIKDIQEALPEYKPIEKITFNSSLEPEFFKKLQEVNRQKIILTGMETHICIYQTALDLINRGYTVFVPKDAVCSRKKKNWKTALELLKAIGAIVTDTETLVFQILERAGTEEFKHMVKYFK